MLKVVAERVHAEHVSRYRYNHEQHDDRRGAYLLPPGPSNLIQLLPYLDEKCPQLRDPQSPSWPS